MSDDITSIKKIAFSIVKTIKNVAFIIKNKIFFPKEKNEIVAPTPAKDPKAEKNKTAVPTSTQDPKKGKKSKLYYITKFLTSPMTACTIFLLFSIGMLIATALTGGIAAIGAAVIIPLVTNFVTTVVTAARSSYHHYQRGQIKDQTIYLKSIITNIIKKNGELKFEHEGKKITLKITPDQVKKLFQLKEEISATSSILKTVGRHCFDWSLPFLGAASFNPTVLACTIVSALATAGEKTVNEYKERLDQHKLTSFIDNAREIINYKDIKDLKSLAASVEKAINGALKEDGIFSEEKRSKTHSILHSIKKAFSLFYVPKPYEELHTNLQKDIEEVLTKQASIAPFSTKKPLATKIISPNKAIIEKPNIAKKKIMHSLENREKKQPKVTNSRHKKNKNTIKRG